MQESETRQQSIWYHCQCGILWQKDYKPYKYDAKYLVDTTPEGAKHENSCKYLPKIIAPIAEEMIYGRKLLFVGHRPNEEAEMRRRGWVTFAIDNNEFCTTTERIIAGDFETFSFPEDFKVNMVWFYHTLESLINPWQALKKVKQILSEDGILFIATPDSDFLYTRGSAGFRHWKRDFNHVLWNRTSLVTYLDSLGFTTVLSRKNHDMRLPQTDDLWLMAQAKFY